MNMPKPQLPHDMSQDTGSLETDGQGNIVYNYSYVAIKSYAS